MFDHVGLRVKDVAVAADFYERVLAPLGYVVDSRDATGAGIGPKGRPSLWLHAGGSGERGVHLAFTAPGREAVDRFHALGLAAGGRDNGEPGPRPDYGPTYYAAFLIDPDGNNIEAVTFTR